MSMLSPDICLPLPNLFPFVADDPPMAVWHLCLVCALVLGAETVLLWWRWRTLRPALLPLAGTVGCLALAIAAWIQSLTFIQVVCATSVRISPEERHRVVERAQAALRLNMAYQDLTVVAVVVTLVLLVWGGFRLALPWRRPRPT